jgi:hypothetical protein
METKNNVSKIFFTALLSLVSFFLYMFYVKVDKIADDMAFVKTASEVKDEQIKNLDRRVTILETAKK